MRLVPLQQGRLDCLCGVYAIVNAVRWIAAAGKPLQRAQQAALFSHVLAAADRHVGLHEALTYGIDTLPLLKVCQAASRLAEQDLRLAIAVDRPFPATATLNDVVVGMRASFKAAPTAFIVNLSGYHDHWSVCTAVTDTSFILFDSSQLRRVALKNCAVTARHNSRTHALHRLPVRAIISLQTKS
jgi:hypothetical protein